MTKELKLMALWAMDNYDFEIDEFKMDIIIHVPVGKFKVNIESGDYYISDDTRELIEKEDYQSYDSDKKFNVYNKVEQKFWNRGMGN